MMIKFLMTAGALARLVGPALALDCGNLPCADTPDGAGLGP
jgi:hypothetical protein